MVLTAEETEIKISTEGAENFMTWFYAAINERRSLTPFYVNSNAKYTAVGTRADISINGLVCAEPSDFEELLDKQRRPGGSSSSSNNSNTGPSGRVRYEVDGFDVHVLNPQFRVACPAHLLGDEESTPSTRGGGGRSQAQAQQKVSLLLQVTGHVQYGSGGGAGKDGAAATQPPQAPGQGQGQQQQQQQQGPRTVAFTEVFVLVPNWDALGPKAPRGLRNFLVMSQNFRAL